MPNIEQSETVQLTIRLIFCVGPAATATIAFVIACFYPINKEIHEKIQQGIEEHKKGNDVIDPIAGHRLKPPSLRGIDEDEGWQLDHFGLGELRILIERGSAAVRNRIGLLCLFSLVCLAGFVILLVGEVDFQHEPGLLAVLYVVGLGVSLTAVVYHAVRFRQSFDLGEFDKMTVREHIKITREMLGRAP